MNDSLEVIVEMIAIVTFCCGVVNYTVIKPLKTMLHDADVTQYTAIPPETN